ncbi:MAG: hypothetical protein E5Y02_30030 [Mesorhizobium sp.]|nr:MAG: hypothetical protein E5Y02_30030 [Mesorhizobium sp.]
MGKQIPVTVIIDGKEVTFPSHRALIKHFGVTDLFSPHSWLFANPDKTLQDWLDTQLKPQLPSPLKIAPDPSTIIGQIWVMFDELGNLRTKEFKDAGVTRGFHSATVQAQANLWRRFHGLETPFKRLRFRKP